MLVVDAGYTFSLNVEKNEDSIEPIADAMSVMGYDAMAVGSAEILLDPTLLQKFKERIKFPLLAANLRWNGKPFVDPYLIKEIDGYRIGIVGLAPSSGDQITDYDVSDPILAAKETISMIHSATDMIVVLAEMDDEQREHFLKEVPGIDVMVQGPRYNRLIRPEVVSDVIVVAPGSAGNRVGELHLFMDPEGYIKEYQGQTITLDSSIPSDPKVDGIIERHRQQQQRKDEGGCH